MKNSKIFSIQALRAVAASMVAVYHTHQHLSARAVFKDTAFVDLVYGLGAAGVHIFFVISGLIMIVTTSGAAKFDLPDFYRRRLTRIYIPYWIFAAVYLCGFQLIGLPIPRDATTLIGSIFLVPPWSPAIVDPAWTLAFEVFFYICFGLAMLLGQTRGMIALSTAFVGLVGLGYVVHPQNPTIARFTDVLLLEFVAGCWIGWFAIRNPLSPGLSRFFIGLAVAIYLASLLIDYRHYPRTIVWGIPSVLLVAGAVSLESKNGMPAILRKFSVLGDSSYSLYLSHTLLIEVFVFTVVQVKGRPLTGFVSLWTFLLLPVFVALAHTMYLLVERPAIRFGVSALTPKRVHASPDLIVP